MVVARSLLYGAIFYIVTALWVLGGIVASLFGQRPTLAVVLSWAEIHHWLARHILGIHVRVEGRIPLGPLMLRSASSIEPFGLNEMSENGFE